MKALKSSFATFLIAYANNGKGLLTIFFIGFILIVNIISHFFVFRTYKLTYQTGTLSIGYLFIFWIAVISPVLLALVMIKWRGESKSNQSHQNKAIEKTILQLKTKALRAQMNPHFIFNCMNAIKLLIQQKEEDKAITYLTAFSKLMRTVLQNSDKKEITLFEEIETCRLYTQLESMRLSGKLIYSFSVDETIDLKSVMVPALILQPFIENAIWHGIMPKEEGGTIHVNISKKDDKIFCIAEDDGIGREVSMRKKASGSPSHQSKGIRLTQSRLELSNTLNQRNATVEIIDKINRKDEPAGTKVILTFNEE